jgi:hypothetical protein
MVSEFAPLAEATSPPLVATPGGVTSCHVPEFPALASTCQNAGLADTGTTAQLSELVAIDVAIETAAEPAAGAAGAADDEDAEDPHAATAPTAASATPVATARLPATARFFALAATG